MDESHRLLQLRPVAAQSTASQCASPFAIAWPVSAEPAASSRRKHGFFARMSRSREFQLSSSASETKEREHGFISAPSADPRFTTNQEVAKRLGNPCRGIRRSKLSGTHLLGLRGANALLGADAYRH